MFEIHGCSRVLQFRKAAISTAISVSIIFVGQFYLFVWCFVLFQILEVFFSFEKVFYLCITGFYCFICLCCFVLFLVALFKIDVFCSFEEM